MDKSMVRRGIHDWEIEEAMLERASFVSDKNTKFGEVRFSLLGRSGTSGRYLKVVYTRREREGVTYYRPISAVDMSGAEKRRYMRRTSP